MLIEYRCPCSATLLVGAADNAADYGWQTEPVSCPGCIEASDLDEEEYGWEHLHADDPDDDRWAA